MTPNRSLACAAAAVVFVVFVSPVSLTAAEPGSTAPYYPPFGLDESAWKADVPAGEDFFEHVNGSWLARTAIPPDRASVTMGRMLVERIEGQLHDIMEEQAKVAGVQPTTTEGKVGAFYAAFMDEKRIGQLQAKPIAAELAAIRAAKSKTELSHLMGEAITAFYGSFFTPSIDVDLKDPARYAIYIDQAGVSLPDRDYYLKSDFAQQKDKFRPYVEQLLTLIGWPDPAGHAGKIVALENRIAQASWPKSDMRDPTKLYNPMTPAQLQAFAPGFDWKAYLDGAGLSGQERVNANERSAFPKIAAIFADTPTDVLKAWLAFTVADNAAIYLSDPFQSAHFEFRDKVLSGQAEQRLRWKRAVLAVSGGDCGVALRDCWGTLDWAVGQVYTKRHFTSDTKTRTQALVGNLLKAFHARIEKLDWMSPATRVEALKKLDTYVVKVGFPEHQRDYSQVVIRSDDLVGDVRRAAAADWSFLVTRSAGPVDRTDWPLTPQTVDAFNGSLRDIIFPAAILQPPNFDPAADPAVNYGAIGSIIGHELTHGFDDQGRHLDSAGALRDWWAPEDAKQFETRAKVLGAQYATYQPVPGLHINPELTMGENLADLGGIAIALDAYHASLAGKPAPALQGLSGDQRFFLAYGQFWRGKMREDAMKQQVVSDPHSFRKFRVNGIVRNVDAWYAAFAVHPGQALYLDPSSRARIW